MKLCDTYRLSFPARVERAHLRPSASHPHRRSRAEITLIGGRHDG